MLYKLHYHLTPAAGTYRDGVKQVGIASFLDILELDTAAERHVGQWPLSWCKSRVTG
jgi:hypothetical protein